MRECEAGGFFFLGGGGGGARGAREEESMGNRRKFDRIMSHWLPSDKVRIGKMIQ